MKKEIQVRPSDRSSLVLGSSLTAKILIIKNLKVLLLIFLSFFHVCHFLYLSLYLPLTKPYSLFPLFFFPPNYQNKRWQNNRAKEAEEVLVVVEVAEIEEEEVEGDEDLRGMKIRSGTFYARARASE